MQPEFENWYDFGNILLNANILFDKNGNILPCKNIPHPQDGVFKVYGENNLPVIELTYKDNILDGEVIQYYENSTAILSKENYKKDELDGLQLRYNKDGILIQEENFNDGTKEGLEKIYNDYGDLVQEAMWINNSIAKVIYPTIQTPVIDKVEIFEYKNKIGLRDSITKDIVIKPVYDYDDTIKGSYYVDPEYWDNYYLYRFRDGYAIFKCGEELCVFSDKGVLIESLTYDTETIIEKYYYGATEYFRHHAL